MKTLHLLVASAAMLVASGLAVAADKPSGTTGPTNPAPRTGTLSAPSDPASDKGSCNSAAGCKVLKTACLKTPGHKYSPASPDGSSGVCTPKTQTSMAPVTRTDTLSTGGGIEDAFCTGKALCKALKASCHGGEWKQLTPTSGKCII